MSNLKMHENRNALNVLDLFATYGFKKTSMSEIANAAGMSRQSIYNQFGSKEAALDWAVKTFLGEVADTAVHRLQSSDGSPSEVLLAAFQDWIGTHVPLLRGTPHGAEILDTAIQAAAHSTRDYEREFSDAVITYMLDSGLFSTVREATEAAFVLHVAAKGLLIKSETSQGFAQAMERVIRVLIK